MGRRVMPMFPVPGSPKWMFEQYAEEMRKMQRRADRLIWLEIFCGIAFAVTLVVCVIVAMVNHQ